MTQPTQLERSRALTDGREFMVLMAACMAMAALSIDLLLPAFPELREAFGLGADATEVSRVVTAFFFGLAAGQLVYGPLSDRFGRKPMLYAGFVVYVVAAVASTFADSLGTFVVWRFVWGLGAAGPRSLALAMVRDAYEGDLMARIMSHVMATLILVPIFAPVLGAGLLELGSWRLVMWFPAVAAMVVVTLMAIRLPETLPPERRRAVSPAALGQAGLAVVRNRETVSFGLAATSLFGIITSFIGGTQLVVEDVYDRDELFPFVFGGIGVALACGALLSGRLVMRLGLARLLRYGVYYLVASASLFAVLVVATDGRPPFWAFLAGCALVLPSVPLLLPNCNTAAMAPLPHVAGMAAALLGAVSTAGGALLGSVVDVSYDGSVRPFALGSLVFALSTATFVLLARPRRAVRPVVGSAERG